MRIPGAGRLRRLANRFRAGALILLYHRVAELPCDPQLLCVRPEHFAEHLEVLRRWEPMRLEDLARGLTGGSVPRRGVVITLDDGYADNLHAAKPMLERLGIPATVFVASAAVDARREFWWDELESLLLGTGGLPEALRVEVGAAEKQWALGDAAAYTDRDAERHAGWSVCEPDDPTPRHRAYRELFALLRPLPDDERRNALDQLLAAAGRKPRVRPSHRTLSADEVVELCAGGLVDVGAHTVSHVRLAGLEPEAQRREIAEGRNRLEQVLGRPVRTFSFPYGTRSDYAAAAVDIVRDEGFLCACSNFAGVVRKGAELFELPRMLVRDWDGDELERRLREWALG